MRDMRKLKIHEFFTIEDMYINGRVVKRYELCGRKGITNKKLINMGGYSAVLNYFGLKPPNPNHDKNELKINNFKKFAQDYLNKYDRLPIEKECVDNGIFGESFPMLKFGGYKIMCEECGFNHKKSLTNSITFYWSDGYMIDEFKYFYGTEIPPSVTKVDIDYRCGDFKFGVSAIQDRFGNYENFLLKCGYSEFCKSNAFSRKRIAMDGHICDSANEQIIDDFLFKNNIAHKVHIKYKEFIPSHNTNIILDFLLDDNTVVEYFGLTGRTDYNDKTNKKLKLLSDNNIKHIDIYPKDLNNLKNIFKDYMREGEKYE